MELPGKCRIFHGLFEHARNSSLHPFFEFEQKYSRFGLSLQGGLKSSETNFVRLGSNCKADFLDPCLWILGSEHPWHRYARGKQAEQLYILSPGFGIFPQSINVPSKIFQIYFLHFATIFWVESIKRQIQLLIRFSNSNWLGSCRTFPIFINILDFSLSFGWRLCYLRLTQL